MHKAARRPPDESTDVVDALGLHDFCGHYRFARSVGDIRHLVSLAGFEGGSGKSCCSAGRQNRSLADIHTCVPIIRRVVMELEREKCVAGSRIDHSSIPGGIAGASKSFYSLARHIREIDRAEVMGHGCTRSTGRTVALVQVGEPSFFHCRKNLDDPGSMSPIFISVGRQCRTHRKGLPGTIEVVHCQANLLQII